MSILDNEDVAGRNLLQVCVSLGIEVYNISIPILLCSQLSCQHLHNNGNRQTMSTYVDDIAELLAPAKHLPS